MKSKLIALFVITGLCASAYADNITLVWQADRAIFCETDWINELLDGFNVTHIDDGKHEIFVDKAIVVVSPGARGNSSYFAKLRKMNYKYGVIIPGDEVYREATDYYKNAQFVFRSYWHEKFVSQKNVRIIPLGYMKGFWNHCTRTIKEACEREFIWSFAGQIIQKPTRKAMITAMQHVPNHHIHEIFSWKASSSLPIDTYHDLLLNTIFVPCPAGWINPDSFRLYEALEAGCIPIVEKKPTDYFSLYFGNHPFLAVDSWDQAPQLINELLANPTRLEQHRAACYQWWLNYKQTLKKDLSIVIRNTLS